MRHIEQGHILHQHRIHANLRQLANQLTSRFQLIIENNGVYGNVDLSTILMSILAQAGNVLNTIAGSCPRPKTMCTNVDSIGTMINGGNTAFQILGRRQQFERAHA